MKYNLQFKLYLDTVQMFADSRTYCYSDCEPQGCKNEWSDHKIIQQTLEVKTQLYCYIYK
jgi:hypothetical protein